MPLVRNRRWLHIRRAIGKAGGRRWTTLGQSEHARYVQIDPVSDALL